MSPARICLLMILFWANASVLAEEIHVGSLMELSRRMEQAYDRSGMLLRDSILEDYLTGVLHRLTLVCGEDTTNLRVRVLLSSSFNAFAAAHGTIYLCTGILSRIENEAQLGALLGHELTHITGRHAVRNLTQIKKSTRTGARTQVGLELLLGGMSGAVNNAVVRSAVTGYSRDLEREADSVGLYRMRKAGYAAAHFRILFLKLKQHIEEEKVREPFFFSTHPRIIERLESYYQLMGKDTLCADEGVLGTARFLTSTSIVINHDARLNVAAGKYAIAEAELARLLLVDSCNVEALVTLGDVARLRGFPGFSSSAANWYTKASLCDTLGGESTRAQGYFLYRTNPDSAALLMRAYIDKNPFAPDRQLMEDYLRQLQE